MRFRPPTASGQLQAGLLARILVGGLFLQPFLLFAQRAVDVKNPEGKWEVLEGCRLVPNSPVDGDSFRILHKGREYGVRLYFVDAPETESVLEERALDQATYFGIAIKDVPRAGQLAARFTREKLSGREFIVQTRWQNGMGRGNVARFYCEVLADGKNLGEELVAHGLARIYAPKTSRRDGTRATTVINLLKNLELTAREQKRGVWNSAEFPRADEVTVTRKDSPARAITEESSLDLNSASYEDLQELPGIGKKLAERIIAHRPYRNVDDLDKVPGMGKKAIDKLRPLVRVAPIRR